MSTRKFNRAAALSAALILVSSAVAQRYIVRDLGDLGGPMTRAFGLNDLGMVSGVSAKPDGSFHAFVNDDGAITEIVPPVNDSQGYAFDINNAANVATTSFDLGDVVLHGALIQGGSATDLGTFVPRALNAGGVVVGYTTSLLADVGWLDRAAQWQAGVVTPLGTLGGNNSYAAGVSDSGRVVGWSQTTNDATVRATLWQNAVPIQLGTLGGSNSQAYGINNVGQVVGWSDTASGAPHAFMYTLDAAGNVLTRTDLGHLAGDYSYAYAVNDDAQIVGTSDGHAFVWELGVMRDLNTLIPPNSGWTLDRAWSINGRGQIVGDGVVRGFPRGFLLTPIIPGDLNCDGSVDGFDIDPFVLALTDPVGYADQHPDCDRFAADMNADGSVNGFDIDPFVAALGGG
ncbi:MAG: hypothetical protein CHACPFDD_00189 [Phycisphaerae bacterium]|nr:hypothetical protein [Phycisphaerae bacterium]